LAAVHFCPVADAAICPALRKATAASLTALHFFNANPETACDTVGP